MVASVAEAAAAAVVVLSCAQATLASATVIDSMDRTDVYPLCTNVITQQHRRERESVTVPPTTMAQSEKFWGSSAAQLRSTCIQSSGDNAHKSLRKSSGR